MALLLIFALISFVYSQGAGAEWWTAKFTQYTTATQAGANTGVIKFNWPSKSFSLSFDPSRWGETYLYNSSRGYSAVLDGSLSTRSSVGNTCQPQCAIALDQHSMPALAPSLVSGGFISSAGAAGTCTKYVPIKGDQFIKEFTADATKICQISFTDGRIFDIDAASFQWTNVAIATPPDCICDEAMDIYILVDHSSSINDPKMVQFKTFVQTFLDNLEISPTGINVGMGWFHYDTGINFPMTGDRATANAAMAQWWTNCTQAATITYCSNNPTEPGCVGCQKSATATSTAIQGYKGPTTSGNWPSGQMDVTGALDYFYNPAKGGSSRKVPKMFVTLTDGAVNHFLNQNGGVGACTFSGCSPDLIRAMQALRAKHNSLFSGYSLTTIAMGIGAPGTDPNLSLSPEHLAILAEGNSLNWFTAPDFSNLQTQLRNLLLRSCPAANDLTQIQCLTSCCGLCVCGKCTTPSYCRDINLCTYQELATCCNEIPTSISQACPTANKCTNAICNKDIKTGDGGYGTCTYTPVDCSGLTNGCTKFNCTPSTGQCTTADNSACPPVPCTWGTWSQWQSCGVSCGTGTQIQTRTQNQTATNGGAACSGSNTNSRSCDMGCCPVACVLSNWGGWSTCATCDSGTKSRTRTKVSDPVCGGTACDTQLSQTVNCPACVNINCSGSNKTITPCDCTTLVKTLQFQVSTPASGPKGVDCKWADQTTFTNVPCTATEIGKCPVDCVESWTSWGWCDCNYKIQNRTHTFTSGPRNGGAACTYSSTFTEQQSCTPPQSQNCPLYGPVCTNNASCADSFACTQDYCMLKPDGKLHCDWSYSTVCLDNICYSNNTCDNSIGCKQQLKPIWQSCPVPNKCSNAICDPAQNGGTGKCTITPVNCTGFTGVDACETFSCNTADGKCTISNRSTCPKVDCTWGDWSSWSSCTLSCGNGTQQMVRQTNQSAKDGGAQCTGSNKIVQSCNPQCCVIDCAMNAWTAWGACPGGCAAGGNRTRSASVKTTATCTGKDCLTIINPGSQPYVTCTAASCTWSETCPPCNPRNCTGQNNTNNGKCWCTSTGEDGYTLITYEVTQTRVGNETNGVDCPTADGTVFNETCTPAQLASCPKPCHDSYSNWSECSCYSSTQSRTYTITQAAVNGGTPCINTKNFSETQTCVPESNCTDIGPLCTYAADCNDELACTIDRCIHVPLTPVDEFHCSWVGILDCTVNNICLEGYCDQTVGCRNKTLGAGMCADANLCKIPACVVAGNGGLGQCNFSDVNCSGYSGTGVDACEKYDCDGTTGKCTVPNRTACPPVDCTWAEWSAWTACPVSCGNSTVSRTRFVNRTSKDGGVDCVPSDANETQPCTMNGGCCPVDCVVSEWSAWNSSACVVCVPGNQIRTRNITNASTCGGQCVALNDTDLSCPPCVPVDCVEQNATSACRCTQNGTYGEWTITYSVNVEPVGPGKQCNFTNGKNWTLPCSATAVGNCPTPCEEKWSNWSVCDCFNNSQWQEYSIIKNATNGGIQCSHPTTPSLILNQSCTPAGSQNCPNYGPTCVNNSDCNDGLACTVDLCVQYTPPGTYHCDWSTNLTCNDTSICTSDRCDQLLGCVYDQILFCDDSNNCTIDYCDPVTGCHNENVTCPDLDVCNLAYCHPTTGCGTVQRNCSGNLSAVLDNCTIAYCDANYTQKNLDNPCQVNDVCAYFSPLGVGIGAGILALIIVLAILAALLFGGGVVAAATNIPVMNENAVQLNPLYMGNDTANDNPLFAEMV